LKYLNGFLNESENLAHTCFHPLTEPTKPGSVSSVSTQNHVCPEIATAGADPRNSGHTSKKEPTEPTKPLPPIEAVRRIVARWPIPLRERWGRRANELADAGVLHPDDERQAFVEIRVVEISGRDEHNHGDLRQVPDRDPGAAPPARRQDRSTAPAPANNRSLPELLPGL
jgi:hypothetical protein